MDSSGNRSQTKQESGGRGTNNDSRLTSKTTSTTSSSRQWEAFKNPRIVRVSRAFGGKDRHSKVCTIRGLRDRRIRLSVPTAIQLYDLQDRLGLSQPSKVVDWLLEATKHDIDNLPPLAVPPEYFTRFQQSPREEYSDVHDVQQLRSQWINANQPYFGVDDNLRGKLKVSIDHAESGKNKSIASNEEPNREDNMFPLGMPFNSYHQWEPNSNLSLGHFGHNAFSSQIDESSHQNGNFPLSLGSSSSPFPSSSQLYYNPIATTFQPIVPSPYMTNYPIESHDPRAHMNHFNFLTSTTSSNNPLVMPTLNLISSSQMKPFSLNDDPRWIDSRDDGDDDVDDDDDDDSQLFEGRAN